MSDIYDEYVHLVRLALEGQPQDVMMLAKKSLKYFNKSRPDLTNSLKSLLAEYQQDGNAVRKDSHQPLPVDIDSKLELLRRDFVVFDRDPIWPGDVMGELKAVIDERQHEDELITNGLTPTRTILFIGPPGVGKTMAAQWLSYQLSRPLLTLDLAAVMSSFLGRTGNNIRAVLNFAQKSSSVLLLDEFDAIAKRRNDDSEVGELKRLVNVILQTIDDWPFKGLLIAATNHPDLLDPAVWRRFERIIQFPNPTHLEINYTLNNLFPHASPSLNQLIGVLSIIFDGSSYAELVRQINNTRRESIVRKVDLESSMEELILRLCRNLERHKRMDLANRLLSSGMSQRRVSELTGISRDTLRRYSREQSSSQVKQGRVDNGKGE